MKGKEVKTFETITREWDENKKFNPNYTPLLKTEVLDELKSC